MILYHIELIKTGQLAKCSYPSPLSLLSTDYFVKIPPVISFPASTIPSTRKSGQAGSGEVLFVVDQGDEVGEGGFVVDVKDQGDEFPDGLCLGKKGFDSGGKG